MNKLKPATKTKVIALYKKGNLSRLEIAEKLETSLSYVDKLVIAYKKANGLAEPKKPNFTIAERAIVLARIKREPILDVARDVGVHQDTITRWRYQDKGIQPPDTHKLSSRDKIYYLKAEVRELKREVVKLKAIIERTTGIKYV